jgi:hypothetical protein
LINDLDDMRKWIGDADAAGLQPGMLADFVLLDRDLTAISPESIRDTEILRTVVGGTTVFRSN